MRAMADESPFLTTQEVARHLRIAPSTVRRMVESGALPAVRIGRQLRIKIEAVEALTTWPTP